MGYAIPMLGVVLIVSLSPAILGAVLRLACRKTHIGSLSIGIGVVFAVWQAAFVERAGVLDLIRSMQEHNFAVGYVNAMAVSTIVLQIGIFAAIASLGIKLTDKLRGPQPDASQDGESAAAPSPPVS